MLVVQSTFKTLDITNVHSFLIAALRLYDKITFNMIPSKAAKGKGWALSFISCAQDTMGL